MTIQEEYKKFNKFGEALLEERIKKSGQRYTNG